MQWVLNNLLRGEYGNYSSARFESSKPLCRGSLILFILQITASLTLLARGWLIYQFDSKIRGILWDEEWMTPILGWFEVTWEDHHANSYEWIDPSLSWLGIGLMLFAAVPFLAAVPKMRWLLWLMVPASLALCLDNYGQYHDSDYKLGMLIEHSLQCLAPLTLLWFVYFKKYFTSMTWTFSIAAALTFIGHGLFAMGYYPVPYYFQTMTMELLRCDEAFAKSFLKVAGYLDFAVAIGIFISSTRRISLYYMVVWGGATALARVITMYEETQNYFGLDEGIGETLVRTSHWSIVLVLVLMLVKIKSPVATVSS